MRTLARLLLLGCLLVMPLPAAAETPAGVSAEAASFVEAWVARHLEGLLELYRELHAHPELSLREQRTAARVAEGLSRAGYRVTRGVGGHGVVGVLANGAGSTLLIRGDMDALPVREETGLAYASQVRVELEDGRTVGVMHACGHDVHTTGLLAAARLLAEARAHWRGTLVVVAQPAEELGRGALAMIEDGLFERFPRPDHTLALHVESELPAGQLGLTPGWAFANVDAVDVTLHGRGGHGARPHRASDPIVAAAHLVTALQTLVSRRIDPQAPAVVTVGSLHAGTKHNVIPDQAHLQLTVRSYTDEVRQQLLEGIAQLAEDTCRTFRCSAPPEVSVREAYTPAVYNDPALVARAERVFAAAFGASNVVEREPSMGGEDFGRYARTLGVPGLLFRLGATPPDLYAASREPGGPDLPAIHSSRFAPAAEPTLATGVRALALLAFELLQAAP